MEGHKISHIEAEAQEQKRYFKRLIELGLVDEIREGRRITGNDYRVLFEEEDFLFSELIGSFTRFIAAPMFIDHFVTHDKNRFQNEENKSNDPTDRVSAFNNSGIHAEFKSADKYMQNKLRLNTIAGVVGNIRVLKKITRELPPEFGNFLESYEFDLNIKGYNDRTNEQKIAFCTELNDFVTTLLNKLVEYKIVQGPLL